MTAPGLVIAVVGAESTGKTTLVHELGQRLRSRGTHVIEVPEALREFCDRAGRTPHASEQAGLAEEQSRRVAEASAQGAVVLADTTALMTAVYSDLLFGDRSLYASAEQAHARSDMTLLMGLDLPWVADGIQRDGPQVRQPVDALIRQALARMGAAYAVIQGQGSERVDQALSVVLHAQEAPKRRARLGASPRWQWACETCDDADCERHLKSR